MDEDFLFNQIRELAGLQGSAPLNGATNTIYHVLSTHYPNASVTEHFTETITAELVKAPTTKCKSSHSICILIPCPIPSSPAVNLGALFTHHHRSPAN